MHSANGATTDIPTLRNTWWVAMWSQDLAAGQLVGRRIMNEPLVFFRTEDGRPTALLDRCAHRWAPLSLGKLLPDDRIACPYHGLEYDAHGVCVKNPHPNYKVPPMMRVHSYPLAEKHSAIWIWMGEGQPDESLIPDFSMLDYDAPDPVSRRDYLLMSASWDLVADNLLDLSHTAFLHNGVLGNEGTIDADTDVVQNGNSITIRREYKDIPVPRFFDLVLFQDGKKVDAFNYLTWHAPACMINDTGAMPPGTTRAQGTGIRGIHFLTPETETTSHYHFAASRWNVIPRSDEENAWLMQQIADIRKVAFKDQDEVIIAAQQLRVNEAGKENLRPVLIGVDAGVERAHKILREMQSNERPQGVAAN
jgi:phenylpropionate dioxygenase-like ring-hydroxylating dioxygenase large terminal subunit